MQELTEKNLQHLYMTKLKNHFSSLPVLNNYLFIYQDKCLFIKQFRKSYKVCATSTCHFIPFSYESTFDTLHITKNLQEAINYFRSYCTAILQNLMIEEAFV